MIEERIIEDQYATTVVHFTATINVPNPIGLVMKSPPLGTVWQKIRQRGSKVDSMHAFEKRRPNPCGTSSP